ncbi:MAG: isochorismate synthase [Ktedonobacteraceae bacterium]
MDRVFVNRVEDPCKSVGLGSISFQAAQFRAVLAQAATRAAQTGQATLASFVMPVPYYDPLQLLHVCQQFYAGNCFYWEQPSQQMALVGAGTALCLETDSAARFAETALAVRTLSAEAVLASDPTYHGSVSQGPVLFGGFSFDLLHPRTPLWHDFPAGLLILPTLLFSHQQQQVTCTLSQLVRATDDLDSLTNSMSVQLAEILRQVPALPRMAVPALGENQEYRIRDLWPAEDWQRLVTKTTHAIQQGDYAKVVLARAVQVVNDMQPFKLTAILQRLRQSYPAAYVFAFQRGSRTFLGATPELLLYAQDGHLHTVALAGSAPRGVNEAEDRRLGSELLHSSKNRQEHEIVASMMRSALAPLCTRVWVAETPELLRLKNIQHLQTAIVGELQPEHCILDALQTLHPTPAVGGSPTEAALAYIRAHEHLDRGWYAGPIGWVDLQGNGAFAVALRSALLEERQATLFAGCGIVADSEPEAEYAESCLKLQVMLRSLSGEE